MTKENLMTIIFGGKASRKLWNAGKPIINYRNPHSQDMDLYVSCGWLILKKILFVTGCSVYLPKSGRRDAFIQDNVIYLIDVVANHMGGISELNH